MASFSFQCKIITEIAIRFAVKKCDVKSLEVFTECNRLLKTYANDEIDELSKVRPTEKLKENEGTTDREKFSVLYFALKTKLEDQNCDKLSVLKNLLMTLTVQEEENIIDVILDTMMRPSEVVASLM
jgi:hypothetical protein